MSQPVHEEIVTELPVRRLNHPMLHYSTVDFQQYQRKLNQYILLEKEVVRGRRQKVGMLDRLVRPAGKFLFLYIWKLGFLDGVVGLRYAMLSSYYAYLKYKAM